ncbi:MAG: Thioredoxin [Planctomycetaceae bacterium]|nr:Thioredoxin [Planctomycetaceae bacterium]
MISNRKPWRLVVPVLLTLVAAAQMCSAKSNLGPAWKRSYQEAEAEARRLDRPLLLHFGATWCGPCKQMEAQVLNSAEVRRALKDYVVAVKIDIDEHPEIAQRYGVDSVPADVIISPTGAILDPKSVGGQTREAYVAKLIGSGQRYLASRQTTPLPPVNSDPVPPVAPVKKNPDPPKELVIAMDGYCPVTLWRTRQWTKGNKAHGADYQGVRFYFQTRVDRDDFIADPSRYAPQLLGCDPVLLHETERAIAGTPKYAAYFDGDLYLFADVNHRNRFKAAPEQFTHTRHVNLDEVEHTDTRLGMKN